MEGMGGERKGREGRGGGHCRVVFLFVHYMRVLFVRVPNRSVHGQLIAARAGLISIGSSLE